MIIGGLPVDLVSTKKPPVRPTKDRLEAVDSSPVNRPKNTISLSQPQVLT